MRILRRGNGEIIYNIDMKSGFSLNIYGLIFAIMLVVAALTYLLPAGQYDTVQKDGRSYTVAGSYHAVASNPQGLAALF